MAAYNEILAGRYNRMLQKLFSMKGDPPARSLTGEVTPIFPFFNGVENRYLEGWDRFGMTVYTAAVAAQNSAFQIRNPLGSNAIAAIEKMTITVTVADLVEIRIATGLADLANVVPTTRLDARTIRPGSMMVLSQGNNIAAAGSVIDHVAVAANASQGVIFTDDQEIVILPGDGIRLNTIGLNEILRVSFQYRERPLEPSELTL